MKACCSGCSAGVCASPFCSAYHEASPSNVVSDLLATAPTGVTHERISTPSASTEQEPHCASPQPKRGPHRGQVMRIFQVVMRGLDPRIHRLGQNDLGEEDGSPGQARR